MPQSINPDSLSAIRTGEEGLPREAYALLAQANLLRVRGRWQEATERCMAALKLSPENASAQSLLGDIYENQGCIDDAIQWYQMALDVNPDSPADKMKLARLQETKARNTIPLSPATSTPPSAVLSEVSPPVRLQRVKLDTLLRFAAIASGLLILIIILLAAMISSRNGGMPWATLGAGHERQVNAPPVVAPLSSAAATIGPDALPYRDPAEQAAFNTIQADPQMLGQGISLIDVQADPRQARVTITISYMPSATVPVSRSLLLQASLRALQAASRATDAQTAGQFTVRCLLASADSHTKPGIPLVFEADTARSALATVNGNEETLTTAQGESIFTNLWWSPLISG